MPRRKIIFINEGIYHVICRGIARQPIFKGRNDYSRALKAIDFYRYFNRPIRFSHLDRLPEEIKDNFFKNAKKENDFLVEILAFCLMPNHIHFLLKQIKDHGTQIFMRDFQNSYARYFNTKNDRIGGLFQSTFKAVLIETDEQLLHVSRYIHLNPISSGLIEEKYLDKYLWSSFPNYNEENYLEFVSPKLVLDFFKSKNSYRSFVFDRAEYQKELEKIKHLILEK